MQICILLLIQIIPAYGTKIFSESDILNHKDYNRSLQIFNDIENQMAGIKDTDSSETVRGLRTRSFHSYVHLIYVLLKLSDAKSYFEIGSWCGASLALALSIPEVQTVISLDQDMRNNTPTLLKNAKTFNKYNAKTYMLSGNSHQKKWKDAVADILKDTKVDVLFIDGDHRMGGAFEDFVSFQQHVRPGGFIIWDDYNDNVYSPGVAKAVSAVMKSRFASCYRMIGDIPNVAGACSFGHSFKKGGPLVGHEVAAKSNEFIMQKLYSCQ